MIYEQARSEALLRLQNRLNFRRALSRLPDSERNLPRLDLYGLTPNQWIEEARKGNDPEHRTCPVEVSK